MIRKKTTRMISVSFKMFLMHYWLLIIDYFLDAEINGSLSKSKVSPAPSEKNEDVAEKSSHGKHQSVLQAKLTKLAVQISYAGKQAEFIWFFLMIDGKDKKG